MQIFVKTQKWICDSFLDKRPKGAPAKRVIDKNPFGINVFLLKSAKKTGKFQGI